MSMLITGASGFVGRQLALEALVRGLPVRVAVRRPVDGWPAGAEVVRAPDLAAGSDWSEALAGVSVIAHCAARVHVRRERARDSLTEYRRVNVDGTLRLATQAAMSGVRRLVFLSSIGVNGEETSDRPFTAEDAVSPRSPYAVSKYEAERGLAALSAQSDLETVVIRAPLVYGPGAPGNWSSLVRWVRSGVPLPLGAIRNRRSLVALDNLVDLVLHCAQHPAAARQTFLVADEEDVSTTELIRRLAHALGCKARLLPVPKASLLALARLTGTLDTMRKLVGSLQIDISRTRAILGWSPPVDLREGLRRAAAADNVAGPL